jgi:5-methyltetrahydrofolate--homocysteine methyltransferase
MEKSMSLLEQLSEALQQGNTDRVTQLTQEAIDLKSEPQAILDQGLVAGMTTVGTKFKKHEIFLPHVLLAARAMHAGMELLKPLLIRDGIPTIGRVVIGTVQGDQHDMGKNLVGIMLKGAGLDVFDLGKDVAPEQFVEKALEIGADVIGMSALLTTTMPVMKTVVEIAIERGIRDKTKIIVGGAPLSNEYASCIGADAYCFDGMSAVDCVKSYLNVR